MAENSETCKPIHFGKLMLFAGYIFYPKRGWEDFIDYFPSIAAAKDHIESNKDLQDMDSWAQIVQNSKVVLTGRFDPLKDDKWNWFPEFPYTQEIGWVYKSHEKFNIFRQILKELPSAPNNNIKDITATPNDELQH